MSRILVVEDDVAILRGVCDNLAYEGHEVLTASDGDTGLRLLSEERPELMVLDLMLPKLNGYELCRRARGEGISIPILMLTARGEEMDRVARRGSSSSTTSPGSPTRRSRRPSTCRRRRSTVTCAWLTRGCAAS